MILNHRLYQETFKNFFLRDHRKKRVFNIRYLRILLPSFSEKMCLITGTMHSCACANSYWKCVKSKCLRVGMLLYASAYILQYSTKKNIINENIYDGERRNVYCKLFPINLPKLTTSEALQQFILQGFTDFFQRSFIPVL